LLYKTLKNAAMEKNEKYEIKMKRPVNNEKHLEGLNENERKMIKLMASMIVKSVIKKVDEEKLDGRKA